MQGPSGESASLDGCRYAGWFLGLAMAMAILFAAPAAADEKVPLFDFCASGSLAGQCNTPRGIAVNTTGNGGVAAGTVYVGDFNNNRIQVFTSEGAFIRTWGKNVSSAGGTGFEICAAAEEANCKIGEEGGAAGELKKISGGLALDQATGNVYVVDRNNNRIQAFTSEGAFISTWGKDVSSAGGTGFEICTAAEEANCKVGLAGTGAGEFTFGTNPLTGIGTDSSGNVYVTDSSAGRVQKFDSTGNFLAMGGWDVTVDGSASDPTSVTTYQVCTVAADCKAGVNGSGLGQFSTGNPSLLAVSPTGDVYAGDAVSPAKIVRLSSSLSLVDATFAPAVVAEGAGNLRALAVENSADAHLYFSKVSSTNIVEIDPVTQTKVADHAAGAANWLGLAVRPSNGRLYATNNLALSSGKWIRVLGSLPPPVATLSPVSATTGESATVSGTVDPQGGAVTCKYQLSEDSGFPAVSRIEVAEPDCSLLADGGGPQPIGQDFSDLIPNTHYFVRLVVSRGTAVAATSDVEEFDTDAVPPVVSSVGAVEVLDTSLRLVGMIDPQNEATNYVFEYGTTPGLGSATTPVSVGNGVNPVVVSQVIAGLNPNTTYHFRLSATNPTGTTTSGTQTVKTRIEPPIDPVERKYEQVTPDAFNNVDAGILEHSMMTAARDGNTVGICNFYPPEGEGTGSCGAISNSRRTATGWQSRSFLPPTCAIDPLTGNLGLNGAAGSINLWSANLDLAVFTRPEFAACPFSPLTLDPDAQTDVSNLYRGDFISGTYDLLAPNPSLSETAELSAFQKLGASDDFDVIFYQSQAQQTGGAPAGSFAKLYEWDHGTLRLASVKPPAQGGTPFTESVEISYGPGAVSDTGDRAFFQSPPAPDADSQLYMREGGATTYDIGQTECTTACGSVFWKAFATASDDGSMAFFETPEKLSDDDNVEKLIDEDKDPLTPPTPERDLYLYRQSANPASDRNLWVLSRDNEPADGTSAELRGELGHSEDGSVVFFAGAGQIVPGATTAPGFKVYRWRWNNGSPTVNFLANLDGTTSGFTCKDTYMDGRPWRDEQNWTCEPRNLGERFLPEAERIDRVRADGGQLTIDTIKALDAVADSDSTRDVYTWDEADGWRCVSCQLPGEPSAGDSQVQGPNGINGRALFTQNALPALITSSDGKQIFFTSRDQLVADDTNGTVRDVYEWNDGALGLISSGTSDEDNLLVGASASGNDVFFLTSERLVGWDTDDLRDIYDARVGGGFPEPDEQGTDPCEGEACRGDGSSAPDASAAGTAVIEHPGNSVDEPPKRCRKGTRKVTIKGKQVCKKTPKRHKKQAKKHGRAASNDRRASR